MNYQKYLSIFDKVQASNKVLTLIVIVIGTLVVFNIFATLSIVTNERIILVPPGLQSQVQISESKVDEQYLIAYSRYILGLLLNYTPITIKSQYEELLLQYDSSSYPIARTVLFNLVDTTMTSGASSTFMPQRFVVDQSKSIIKIQGGRKIYKDDRSSINSMQVYQISFKVYNSKVFITELKEVEGI